MAGANPARQLLTSAVAIEEAKRNLRSKRPSALTALNELLTTVHTVQTPDSRSYRGAVAQIAEKDRPILAAALACKANWFLTGDRKDFGHLMGKRIEGVMIASPRTYLESR